MENKVIKIKSYQYMQQNLLIIFTLLLGIPTVVIAIFYKPFAVVPVVILGMLAGVSMIGAVITRLGCTTYDIFSESGIKRVRRGEVLFSVGWSNVETAFYGGFSTIVILSPFTLNIKFIEPLKENENRSYDNKEWISTPMSKKALKDIEAIIPLQIKHKGK